MLYQSTMLCAYTYSMQMSMLDAPSFEDSKQNHYKPLGQIGLV